ncbi:MULTISPECIES: MFS transporter [unclassified Aeromicrobium]|uniref:MFS transporter n=1 Tax=unclassified Aeromicrobium TaxID=2633570 RepID=UPI002096C79A|nr:MULTISPECIES: MFS transporter [unclassified Aeromicrobium]MCO7237721.1 MFS transporter [Aeromicrobium sp. CnD17-E]MDR6117681.1 putative MFS family arabinose efflux permease [Aeromicrobium sp. SORGH_AS_0981]
MTSQIAVLQRAHVPRLLTSGLIGRIPSAIAALAATLVMRDAGLPFDRVGAAVGLFALGLAVGGPTLGRWVDRRGQPRVLVVSSLVAAVGFLTVDAVDDHWQLICVAMFVAGFATPPLEPCLRALWPDLVDDDQLDAALSLDAAAQEIVFIVGPLMVAVSTAVVGPSAALWLAAALGVAGALVFARSEPSRLWRPQPGERHWFGPLNSVGLVLLFSTLFFSGAAIGALTITAVSYAEDTRSPGGAGLLLAVNAVGALAGALIYGSLRWTMPHPRRLVVCCVGMCATYLTLVTIPSPPGMFAAMFATGVFLAPLLAVSFSMVGRLCDPVHVTEAFAWLVTLFTMGNAVGSPLAGLAADGGLSGSAWVAAGTTAVGLLVAVASLRRWMTAEERT